LRREERRVRIQRKRKDSEIGACKKTGVGKKFGTSEEEFGNPPPGGNKKRLTGAIPGGETHGVVKPHNHNLEGRNTPSPPKDANEPFATGKKVDKGLI